MSYKTSPPRGPNIGNLSVTDAAVSRMHAHVRSQIALLHSTLFPSSDAEDPAKTPR